METNTQSILEQNCEQAFLDFANNNDGFHKYITRTINSKLYAQIGNQANDISGAEIADAVIAEIADYFAFSHMEIHKVTQ
jgi:hypothetical protein